MMAVSLSYVVVGAECRMRCSSEILVKEPHRSGCIFTHLTNYFLKLQAIYIMQEIIANDIAFGLELLHTRT
jgi:hypothetical protein